MVLLYCYPHVASGAEWACKNSGLLKAHVEAFERGIFWLAAQTLKTMLGFANFRLYVNLSQREDTKIVDAIILIHSWMFSNRTRNSEWCLKGGEMFVGDVV